MTERSAEDIPEADPRPDGLRTAPSLVAPSGIRTGTFAEKSPACPSAFEPIGW